jgi:plasmid stability protein
MPVTLTIKQVPESLAEKLRRRAAASHRSLQGELMAILEDTVLGGASRLQEPEPSPYMARSRVTRSAGRKVKAHGRRLTLAELWERARRLGPGGKSESAAIVRELRDERYGR